VVTTQTISSFYSRNSEENPYVKMTAAVLTEYHRPLEIDTVDLAAPQEGEVRVKISACGVCRSDLHVAQGKMPGGITLPLIPGHEASGIVDDIGANVHRVAVGDRVVLATYHGCGHCDACLVGNPYGCNVPIFEQMGDGSTGVSRNGEVINLLGRFSGFAEYAVVSERACVKLPDAMPLEVASLLGCAVLTGFGSVIRHAKVDLGSSTAVIGLGGVGLSAIQACYVAGATTIIAIDVDESKLEMARRFGATHVVNAEKEDACARVLDLTNGAGVDFSFEVIGIPAVIRQAYNMTANGGLVTVVGVSPPGSEVAFPATDFGHRKTVTWASAGNANAWNDIPRIVDLYLAGRWELDLLVSGTRPLVEANEAMADLSDGHVIRTLLTPAS
jgi:S-(hydroxymethyl)glutathione dehydrogenase / alcohol dehydrogenase